MVEAVYQNIGNGIELIPGTTEEQRVEWEVENKMMLENGQLVPVPLTIIEAKSAKEIEIRAKGSTFMLQIVAPYTAEERDTWPSQVTEAKAYADNPLAATPMLTALCTQRGNTITDQAARILGNEAAFKTAVGSILGIQQAKIDLIAAATTVAEVEGITW